MTHERAELIQQICAPDLIQVEAAPSGDTAQLLCEGWALARVIRLHGCQRRARPFGLAANANTFRITAVANQPAMPQGCPPAAP